MALAVPSPNRSRASSTCVRPALSINTLGSRRSSSLVLPVQNMDPSVTSPPVHNPSFFSSVTASQSLVFPSIAAKCLKFLHLAKLHRSDYSSPSSPHNEPDLVLPLSASSQTTFGDVLSEKHAPSSLWRLFHSTAHAPILFVIFLFPLSTSVVLLSLYSLPASVTWPRNLTELAQLGKELQKYSRLGPGPFAHVVGVLSVSAVWKHAWSIPGSVIWNVLAGALFHPLLATLLLTLLTTVGSVIATALSTPLAPVLSRLFPRALDMTRSVLEGETDLASGSETKSPAWVRLSILRLIGVVPWSGINIACGVCGVPLTDCFLAAFIGGLPWTAVTCQIGDILQKVASAPSPSHQTVSSLLTSPDIILKLALLSFLSLAPILGRDRLRALISSKSLSPSGATQSVGNERLSRWVRDRKTRIRTLSQSHSHDVKRRDDLVQEKVSLP